MNPNPAHRRRAEEPAPQGVPWLAPPPDPEVLRAQERLDALVAEPPSGDQARRASAKGVAGVVDDEPVTGPADDAAAPVGHTAALADLEARVAAAERRAAAAVVLARTADTRARAAAARAEDILFALPDLARELRAFVDADEAGAEQLTEAIERMRARVRPAATPAADGTRVIVIPD